MRILALLLTAALSIPSLTAATRRHIVGRGTGADSPFGVVANTSNNAISTGLALARNAKVGWTTIQFTWSVIQPSVSQANFAPFDQLVTAATNNDMRILGRIAFATQWNNTAPASVTDPSEREKYPPANLDDWRRFVFTVVAQYKKNVHHWEIWYQPDLAAYWKGTPAQYAELLAVAYQAVKSADPSASVLLGGLALTSASNSSFFPEILNDPANPAANSFDIMSFHAYGGKSDALRLMNLMKSQMAFGGAAGRQIWITEFGYPSDPAKQNVMPYVGGDAGQTAYVKDMAPYLLSIGARKVFWYRLLDSDPASGDPFATYGLVTSTSKEKPALTGYADAIKAYRP